ncbi:hypothetical protein JOM56_014935 [Amanita muscaria]
MPSFKLLPPKRPLQRAEEATKPLTRTAVRGRLYSEVVKTVANNENHPSAEVATAEAKDSGAKSPTDGKRAGLSTRDANSKKHPGLADLDEDDLKARRKKDRAALKREKEKEKKKYQQRLLAIGTKKLAAHEDQLLSQVNGGLEDVVRPPPGPVTRKAARPKAPAVETENRHPNKDVEEDGVPLESDASRASDGDFSPPPDSDSPSESERELGPLLEDDIFMQIDGFDDSDRTKPNQARCQRGQVRAMIEAHRKVGQTPGMPKASKRKTTDDDVCSPSRRSPLRKKSKTFSSGERNSNIADFGGILDDELNEGVPPAAPPSQVKVTTRFTHNTPLLKVEALDPGLTHSDRTRSAATRKDRGYRILQLSCEHLQLFKKLVTPAFRAVIACQPYPWDNSNPDLLVELQFIWNIVYPTVSRNLQANGEEYAVSTQRLCEYRARIARDVMTSVENYIDDVCGNAPSAIEEHVGHLLEKGYARYMWRKSDADNPQEFEGLFMAPYIIAGMTSHLEMTAGLPNQLQVVAYPRGALALATVAAERGLQAWLSGVNTFGEDLSNKKEEEFSESNWGVATKAVIPAIERLSEKKWKKILSAATEATLAVQTTPRLTKMATYAPDDARALAYEPDSD